MLYIHTAGLQCVIVTCHTTQCVLWGGHREGTATIRCLLTMGNCLKLFKEHSGPKTQKASSRFRCWQTWQEKLKVECQVLDWASISFTCWVFCDFFFARFWPLNSWILSYNYTITKKNTAMHHILGLCDMLHLFWQWWTIIFEEEMWSEQRTAALFSPLTEMLFFSSCLFKAPPQYPVCSDWSDYTYLRQYR